MRWFRPIRPIRPILDWFFAHRRRLAPLVLGVGVALIASRISAYVPRETNLVVDLGPEHARALGVRIHYLCDGEEVRGILLPFPTGAPRDVRHTSDLRPGRYVVHVELEYAEGSQIVDRSLVVPTEGDVRILLTGTRGDGEPTQ